jgi:hypothetical protein
LRGAGRRYPIDRLCGLRDGSAPRSSFRETNLETLQPAPSNQSALRVALLAHRMGEEMTDVLIGVMVQQPANWRAGLPRLADKRTKAARQHSLWCPISADDIEAPPNGAIEGCCCYPPTCCDLGNCGLTFRFHRSEAHDLPRDCQASPVKSTYRA